MIQVNLDCEGPLTENDNAYELCTACIPRGGDFFARVSKYDDYLADVQKREGYKAGDTLKLVLPFLKAYGVTSEKMREFSFETLRLLPGTKRMLPAIAEKFPVFIISTSYRPYLDALCRATGFPAGNIYCTDVDIDKYHLSSDEAARLKDIAREIADQPMLAWPDEASDIDDLDEVHRQVLLRLDDIFWRVIPEMQAGAILHDVNPVGGNEKALSVRDSLRRTGLDASHIFYAGDSITDVQALEFVGRAGGVAMSFNGNSYCIRAARWACLSENTAIVGAIADAVDASGMDVLDSLVLDESGRAGGEYLIEFLREKGARQDMLSDFDSSIHGNLPSIYRIEKADILTLISESEDFRKGVRGVSAGELG